MSSVNQLEQTHKIFYREHKVEKTDKGFICQDCKLNAWSDNFPEHCIGPTTVLELDSFDTNDEVYAVTAKIFHLHNRALIDFSTGNPLDNGFSLDIDAQDLNDLIEKLNQIKEVFK